MHCPALLPRFGLSRHASGRTRGSSTSRPTSTSSMVIRAGTPSRTTPSVMPSLSDRRNCQPVGRQSNLMAETNTNEFCFVISAHHIAAHRKAFRLPCFDRQSFQQFRPEPWPGAGLHFRFLTQSIERARSKRHLQTFIRASVRHMIDSSETL